MNEEKPQKFTCMPMFSVSFPVWDDLCTDATSWTVIFEVSTVQVLIH